MTRASRSITCCNAGNVRFMRPHGPVRLSMISIPTIWNTMARPGLRKHHRESEVSQCGCYPHIYIYIYTCTVFGIVTRCTWNMHTVGMIYIYIHVYILSYCALIHFSMLWHTDWRFLFKLNSIPRWRNGLNFRRWKMSFSWGLFPGLLLQVDCEGIHSDRAVCRTFDGKLHPVQWQLCASTIWYRILSCHPDGRWQGYFLQPWRRCELSFLQAGGLVKSRDFRENSDWNMERRVMVCARCWRCWRYWYWHIVSCKSYMIIYDYIVYD